MHHAPRSHGYRTRLLAGVFALSAVTFALEAQVRTQGFQTSPVVRVLAGLSEQLGSRLPLRVSLERIASEAADLRVVLKSGPDAETLLQRHIRLRFVASEGAVVHSGVLALSRHPSWIAVRSSWAGDAAVLDESAIAAHLRSQVSTVVPPPQDCAIVEVAADEYGVARAHVASVAADSPGETPSSSCLAREGYEYDAAVAAHAVVLALLRGDRILTVALAKRSGAIVDRTQDPPVTLTLIGPGRSNFKGSGEGRKANVRKGLNERINNVVVPSGQDFSFVKMLGPVTLQRGWQKALTIFNGDQLVPAPGGGICQTSTTTYRAVLQAGMPIVKRRSHSLYVVYYEKYGVGLDATVYPGNQDLIFRNDFPHSLFLQAYTEGDEAYVNIYGVPDGRTVTLDGPYFSKYAPSDLLGGDRKMRKNEIAWIRTITSGDGQEKREVILSQYKELPRSLPDKFAATVTSLHAAAPSSAEMLAHQ